MGAALAYGILAGVQMASGFQQAEITMHQARLSQRINDLNAKYAELDAYELEKEGVSQSARYKTNIDALAGRQRVAFAAQNVDISSGTAAELIAETGLTGFLNQMDIENAARAKARGLKYEASNMRLNAFMQGLQGELSANASRVQGLTEAFRTGLSGYEYLEAPTTKPQKKIAK